MFKKLKDEYKQLKSPKEKFQWAFSLIKSCIPEFIICTLILYSPAWIPLILGAIWKSNSLIAFGVTAAGIWASPFPPFWLIDVACTLGLKAIFEKVQKK